MATLNITAIELDKLIKMKDEGRIAEAWNFLGSKGDAYGFLAGAIVSDNTADMSPIARLFYEMVRSQWKNTGAGGVWGGQVFMDVGKQHLENYLNLLEVGGNSGAYVLPNTIQIETSYKAALAKFGLPPITAIDSLFSVIDLAAGNGNGSALAGDFSWAQFMDLANQGMQWLGDPAPSWQSDRIKFNSEVFKDDIDSITAIVTFGRTLVNTLESYGAAVAGVIPALAPGYWLFKLADGVLDYTMMDFARSNAVNVLFRQLDGSIGKTVTDSILDASGNNDRLAFGMAIDQMANMLGVGLPPSNGSAAQIFDNVKTLSESGIFQALAGKLTLSPADGGLESQAKTDFGAFLALHSLSPVVIGTTDAGALAALKAAHGQLATDWQADMNARLYGDTDYDYSFSEQWYEDRAALLQWQMVGNNHDVADGAVITAAITNQTIDGSTYYADRATQTEILVGPASQINQRVQVIFGNGEAESLSGYGKNDRLYGGAGNDEISGLGGNDYAEGGSGADKLYGGAGNDKLLGGADADTLNGGVGNDRLEGASGNDNLSGVDGDDDLQGGGGADILNGGAGNDTLVGGQGVDRYVFAGAFGSDAVVDSDGNGSVWIDGVRLTGGLQLADNMWASDDLQWQYLLQGEDLWIRSAQGVSRSVLLTEWNSMGGNRLGIALSGIEAPPAEQSRFFMGDQRAPCLDSTGNESLDLLYNKPFDWGQVSWATNGLLINGIAAPGFYDVIHGSAGADRIEGLGGGDALDGGADDDLIDGGSGNDFLAGAAGSDTILGGDGNDFISSASSITVGRQVRPMDSWEAPAEFNVTVLASGPNWGVWRPQGTEDALTWSGMGAVNRSDVTSSDWIEAGSGDDLVIAGWGNDYLDGGSYQDTLFGLAGDDVILGGQGPQTLWNGDVLWGDGSADPTAMEYTPEERHGNDFLDGGDGDDVLHGQGGSDVLYGGTGEDLLEGDGDVGFTFHGRDYLDGGEDDDTLHGNGSHDVLLGGAGNDELYGDGNIALEYQGNDYLDGGNDSDKLYGQGKNDTLLGGDGYDELQADYGSTVTINDGDDWLDGGADNDRLWAGGGADSLYGGDGDDHLWGDGEEVPTALDGDDLLDGGAGNDHMWGNGGRDTLLGGLGADWLWGDGEGLSAKDQADYLDGGEGNDTLVGGLGDDALWGGAGDDRLSGDGFSNVANNVPTSATDGNDYLNGDEGNDEMVGGGGIDTLLGGAGSDHIWGDGRYDANFGGSDSIEGGAGADYIYAGSGQDTVRGGDGDDGISTDGVDGGDLLFGGDGKDSIQTYADAAHADSGASTVFGGAGDDRIYALGAAHHVYGDEGDDEFYALSASNPADTMAVSIFGGVGNDYVYAVGASHLVDAGEGDDLVYSVEGSLVHVFDFGYGQDTLLIYDYFGTAATPDVIRLGSAVTASDVTLTRLGENETLLSLQATGDSLSIEYLPNADVGIAASGIGRVEFSDGTVWDAATIESIRNTGKLIVGTEVSDLLNGPASNDTLIGGGGNDSLEGGAGSDRLVGGLGDDGYFVDNVGDWVVESASQGHDRVYSSVSHTLRVNVEELVLTGTAAIDGKGNSLHNQLTGNAGNNQLEGLVGADTLKGGAGADTLAGGVGNDRLFGGAGADVYLFNRGDMRDSITENDVAAGMNDLVQFGSGIAVEQVWFTRSGNHLDVSVIGTSDSLQVNNWYLGERYQVEAFSSADGQTLTSDRVDDLVNAMSVYEPPAAGQIQLPQSYASLVGIIDAGWI